jgi:diaminohydroxyphosphoribosylaminopyrimidine deaminase/5-amino-6-(5-phosphoribosylamino)uracil reductase
MVGAVIVHQGKIIGEGFHKGYGLAHAEVNAIASVRNESLLRQSTLYVNLEPCSHFGKTPPCSTLLLEKGIPRVVIGAMDPNHVSGGGMAILESNGVEVRSGILEEECIEFNKRFYTFQQEGRPWILLKWAESADGFIDVKRIPGEPVGVHWITGTSARKLVHGWRAEEMAILVGTRTAEMDDPELTVREVEGKNPLRLVIDRKRSLSQELKLFNDAAETVVFTDRASGTLGRVNYRQVPGGKDYLDAILGYMHENDYISLMVEGGAKLLTSFIERGLWDEARVFTGTGRFGEGLKAPVLAVEPDKTEMIGKDKLEIFRNS